MKRLLFISLGLIMCFSSAFIKAQDLKVMTFNIRYDNLDDGVNRWEVRIPKIKHLLDFYQPDIIGFQEALPNQYQTLKTILPSYGSYALGRDENNTGEACPIFFNSEKFRLEDSGTFWLSPTPEKISMAWGAKLNRICSWVILKDKKTGKRLKIYNVHLDNASELSRQNSMSLIRQKIKEEKSKNLHCMILGDFNSELSTQQLSTEFFPNLKEASSLAKRVFLENGTYQDFGKELADAPRIDYIFVPKTAKVKSYEIITAQFRGLFPSDHFPVMTELAW